MSVEYLHGLAVCMRLQLCEFEAQLNLGSQLEAVIFSLHAAAARRELTGSALSVIDWLGWIARPLYGADTPLRRTYDNLIDNLWRLREATDGYASYARAPVATREAATQTDRDAATKSLRPRGARPPGGRLCAGPPGHPCPRRAWAVGGNAKGSLDGRSVAPPGDRGRR